MDWTALLETLRREARHAGVSEADADDIAQEAVMRTLEASPRELTAYARKTAKRLAVAVLSGRRVEQGVIVAGDDAIDPDLVGAEVSAEDRLVALDELSEIDRVVRVGWVVGAVDGEGSARRMARKRMRDAMRRAS